ncbi:Uma2 family endonuclease [Egbenema bharatensis]|uniref:Uma2 family endonuclease n=1 Tax=Egbenema bharatensis TaxID=3463334 RepID=UPI003A871C26
MIQALQQPTSFDDFVKWLPATSEGHYELHREVIVEMPKPRGKHSEVAGFVAAELNFAIRQQQLPYFIPKECIVRSRDGTSGYEPDVIVVDRTALANEPRWERESVLTSGETIKLIVEVVSTNWQDDYSLKLTDYEALGIPEYWAVDYAGLGGRLYIGYPKRPTLSIYNLTDEGEYEVQQFRESDRLCSSTFPNLNLVADQVFAAE